MDYFEIDEIEVFVDISLSYFNRARTVRDMTVFLQLVTCLWRLAQGVYRWVANNSILLIGQDEINIEQYNGDRNIKVIFQYSPINNTEEYVYFHKL